jgi:hypothetical protein
MNPTRAIPISTILRVFIVAPLPQRHAARVRHARRPCLRLADADFAVWVPLSDLPNDAFAERLQDVNRLNVLPDRVRQPSRQGMPGGRILITNA